VRVPIKIGVRGARIDATRVADKVEQGTTPQITRALDAVDLRGADVRAELSVKFNGAANNQSAEDKQAVEAAIAKGVIRAATVARRTKQAKAPAAPPPSPPVPAAAKPEAAPRVRSVKTWPIFDSVNSARWEAAARLALDTEFGPARPVVFGLMFLLKESAAHGITLMIVNNGEWRYSTLTKPRYSPGASDAAMTPSADSGQFTLSLETDGFSRYRDMAIKHAGDELGRTTKKVGQVMAVPDVQAPQDAHVEEATKVVDAKLAGWETSGRIYYWLKASGITDTLIPFTTAHEKYLASTPVIRIACLVEEVEVPEGGEDGLGTGAGGEALEGVDGDGGDGGGAGDGDGDGGGGGGDGGAGDALGSDVTAVPAPGTKSGRGIVIAPAYKEGGSIFPEGPHDPKAKVIVIKCQPYDGEPHLDRLGTVGEEMRRLIAEIAARLDMETCDYPANFCISAARMINVRASQVEARFRQQDKGFFEELAVGTIDGSGSFSFQPKPSIAIQYLQHLAATIPRLRRLLELVVHHSSKLVEYFAWATHFFEKVMEPADEACARIFYYANQIVMAQLLNTSLAAVEQRQKNIDDYEKVFAVLVKTQLADQVELIMLRDSLLKFTRIAGLKRGEDAYKAVRYSLHIEAALQGHTMSESAQFKLHENDPDLLLRLAANSEFVFGRAAKVNDIAVPGVGQIVANDQNVWAIRGSDSTLYTVEMLEKLIAVGQQMVTQIDPLISQMTHNFVSSIRPLAQDPSKIRAFLEGLLKEMAAKNHEVTRKNLTDIKYAFEHGQIHRVSNDEKSPPMMRTPTIPNGRYVFSGIHALAHQLVGTHFENDAFYRSTVDNLFGHEEGWKSLKGDLVFFGGVVLSVICPPLGAAFSLIAGLAIAIGDYRHAKEQEDIYGSLIDPDRVLDYAQIQVEMFVAKLSIGLSFLAVIPEGIAAVKGVAAASKRLATKGVESSAKRVALELVETQLAHLEQVCAKNFAIEIAKELASQEIQGKIIETILDPIIDAEIEAVEAELRAEGLL
jgi:hypothetical protein